MWQIKVQDAAENPKEILNTFIDKGTGLLLPNVSNPHLTPWMLSSHGAGPALEIQSLGLLSMFYPQGPIPGGTPLSLSTEDILQWRWPSVRYPITEPCDEPSSFL